MRKSMLLALCLFTGVAGLPAAEPLVVAHRGLLLHAPENTLANFRACLDLRLGFEFDVERTKDGELICIHDATVDRTTNGTGKVSALTSEQIHQLDAGSWFDTRFAGERVPRVEEVIKLVAEYQHHNVLIAVDLKAESVAQEVARLGYRYNVLHRLVFIGRTISESKVRDEIQQISNKAQTAAVANTTEEFSSVLATPNANWVYFRYLPPREQVEAVHRAGKKAFIAGANVSGHVPANWRHATDVGIDGILTDFPLELQATLRRADTR